MTPTGIAPIPSDRTAHSAARCAPPCGVPGGVCRDAAPAAIAMRDARPVPDGALLSAEDADAKMCSVVRRSAQLKDDFVTLYREVHDLYRHFAAMAATPSVDGGGGRFHSFSDLCARGLVKSMREVGKSVRMTLIDALMREVVMIGAGADDMAAACCVSPTSYRSVIQLFNAHYDGTGRWIEMSFDALKAWFCAATQDALRATLWAVWRRARAIMAAANDKCLTRYHFDAASREFEYGGARSPDALIGNIRNTRQADGMAAAAATETRVSWQRMSRCDGPSLTISSGTRTTTASACAGAAAPVSGAKRPHSAISCAGGDGDDDGDLVVVARRQRVATERQEADRLRSGLAGAAGLRDLGPMVQAMARLMSLYPPGEVRALVAAAYPPRGPTGRRADGTHSDGDATQGDDNNNGRQAAGLWAPTAFVEWFAANHETYGLANTPDYAWNTMVPPRSPSGDADRWSRAYWLAGAKP
ncbi:hypothetical protein psal_cds_1406 [Pandoravirus salinus]|uniref:Uncharacterized protein n=1 Tax=Pandoravirus salinus TaxID=1349410 RepID=S4W5Z6_9VIRU|nr:hypothetical protein psal_cds_1406 [Pandoravirus salinus]AGO85840.1 hypothetical protein psal_cds_1406 [Pandoravirus salinus]